MMKYRIFILLIVILVTLQVSLNKSPGQTEEIQRIYDVNQPVITVPPAIFSGNDTVWQDMGNGMKRKIFFNDRLTFVILQINRPVEKEEKVITHSHPHDQISYVQEGKILVKVGDEEKIIETGGVYIVPSNIPHGLSVLSEQLILVEVFTPTREDFRTNSVKSEK